MRASRAHVCSLLVLLPAVVVIGGCGDGTEPTPTVNSVAVSPATGALDAIGATLQLTAVARDADNNAISGVTFTWTSGNTGAATVDASGLVTAVANGMATITATAQGVPGEATVTVEQVITMVAVTPDAVDSLIGVGDAVQFAAEAQDANANPVAGSTFTWTSSDEAVATVDNTGLVTVVANGTTTITAEEAGGLTGTATFKSATVAAVEALTIDFDQSVSGAGGSAVGLTYDGAAYYTIYDGSAPSPILKFDLEGNYVSATTANTDARALLYNDADGVYYLKPYGTDWYQVNPDNGALTQLLTGIFSEFQSSPALTGDGSQIIEQFSGSVRFLNIATGAEEGTLTGLTVGGPYSSHAIATDGSYLFTIDPTTAYMYDMQGRLVTSFDVPNSQWGIALSYANGMLWVTGSSGSTGTWYGYQLEQQ